ncbi:type I toxin-antitoxin system Ibs family toxin [Kluyvera sichuanensis]
MMKLVIILVILLVFSLPAYSDTRGRRNPPLPSFLYDRSKKQRSQRRYFRRKPPAPSAPDRRSPSQNRRHRQSECREAAGPTLS